MINKETKRRKKANIFSLTGKAMRTAIFLFHGFAKTFQIVKWRGCLHRKKLGFLDQLTIIVEIPTNSKSLTRFANRAQSTTDRRVNYVNISLS